MSAGKGDTPRPVNGDRYRANYEAIFLKEDSLSDILEKVRDQFPYPDWICRPCGETHGRGMPKGHVATWHEGFCNICGIAAPVTEPRDFGRLKKWPILPKKPLIPMPTFANICLHTPRQKAVPRHGH